MKRRKFLLFLLAFVFSLSTLFSVNAFAYTVKYEHDDNPSYYDSSFYDDLYSLNRNPYEWDSDTILSEKKLKSGPFTMLPGASIGTLEKNRLSFVLFCSDESYVNFKPGRLMEGVNVYFKFAFPW